MPEHSRHLILIPSYNTGAQLLTTVRSVLSVWPDVWVVIDGSTDGSERALEPYQTPHPGLRILRRERNGGKGAAVASALAPARAAGFTHALVMDADGQHPVTHVRAFIDVSRSTPEAMVLGQPVFGPEAPLERLYGRKVSIGLTHLETLGREIADPLFGFRIYPIAPLEQALSATSQARGYDFDPEVVVRLFWAGVPVINVPAPCRYLSPGEGGVSHYHYLRDNVKMAWLHLRLLSELVGWRWRQVRRLRRQRAESASSLSASPAP